MHKSSSVVSTRSLHSRHRSVDGSEPRHPVTHERLYGSVSDPEEDVFQYKPHKRLVQSCSHETFLHHKRGGLLLHRRYDPPPGTPAEATLCILHGFGEHSARYENFANIFKAQGMVVHTIDFRGFGCSGGARSSSTIKDMTRDIKSLLEQVSPDLPCFLLGHSMGGLVLAKFLLEHPGLPLAGVIFSSPLFRLHSSRQVPYHRRMLLKLLPNVKEAHLMADVDPTQLSRDLQEVVSILNDRFCLPLLGLNLAASMVNEPYWVMDRPHTFRYPVLVVHGTEDHLTDPQGSIDFHDQCSSVDKTLKLFGGSYHEIHNDINRQELFDYLVQWIRPRALQGVKWGYLDSYVNPYKGPKHAARLRALWIKRALFLLWIAGMLWVYRTFRGGRFPSFLVPKPLPSTKPNTHTHTPPAPGTRLLTSALWPLLLCRSLVSVPAHHAARVFWGLTGVLLGVSE